MLRKTVSTVISRPKPGIIQDQPLDQEGQLDSDSLSPINKISIIKYKSSDQENEIDNESGSVLNDIIELVESLKKHHIIDKILDEPIMYSEYNQEGPNLVADIKIIRDDSEEGIHELFQQKSEETKDSDSSIGELSFNNENNYHYEIINRILTEPKPVINQSVENVNL